MDEKQVLIEKMYAALRWLVDDMSDAGEDVHPESGEVFDSVANAREALGEYEAKKELENG